MRATGHHLLRIAFCFIFMLRTVDALASDPGSGIMTLDPAVVLQSQNRTSYQVVIGEEEKGSIDVFSHQRGAFVSVEAILQRLGYPHFRDDNDQILQIDFPDHTSLTLRFGKQEYISHGITETLGGNDFVLSGTDIFLDCEFLNKTFPIGFLLNQASGKLRIIGKEAASPLEQGAAVTPPDDFPVPRAAPRLPVIVDDIGARTPPVPKTEAPDSDVIRTTEAPAAAGNPQVAAVAASEQATKDDEKHETRETTGEEDVLILQPKIKHSPPSNLFIEALTVKDKLYLPLGDMMKLLEFDITVDAKAGTAGGTFISSDHDFSLDVNSHRLRVNHTNISLNDGTFLMREQQIYVNAADFSKWFDIECRLDRQMMMLVLDSKTALPVETRAARHSLWNKLLASQNAGARDYQLIENPYRPASVPFIDVSLSGAYSSAAAHSFTGDYTILGAGDLGYLTANIYAAGTNANPIDNLRINAGRKDPNAGLLGPLQATAFSFGDIDSPSLPLVTNNSLGRGIAITNRSLNASDNFDTHTITGNAVPGWEVELYRNSLLLGFQTVDANGRYEFLNEPLVYGSNTFRVVLYGPQGQSEDRVENIMIGSTMLKPGQVEYTFSANQEAASMLQFNRADGSATTRNNPQGLRAVGQTRYGVADFLTLGTGIVQTELPDGYHHYASISADTSFAGIYTESNFVQDMNHGWVAGTTALTSINDISIRALHRQYQGYVSEVENDHEDFRKSVSEADLNGQFFMPLFEDFNFGFSALHETFAVQVPRTTYSASLSKSVWGMSFSNTLNYISDSQKRLGGNFGWQTRIDNIMLRADGTYDVRPEFGLHDAAFTAQYRLADDLSAQTQLDQQLGSQPRSTLTQTFNHDFEHYRLSFSGQVDDQRQYVMGISLVFSIAHDDISGRWHTEAQSLSGSGAIASRVFVDENYNGLYDEGEKTLPDTGLRINRIPTRRGRNNDFIAPVNSYESVNVDINPDTLKDPTLSPAVDGYRVMTRPGDVVTLDFPIVSTSEIDGNVIVTNEKGDCYQIPDIVVELDDEGGTSRRRVVSESDGFYTFDKVRPGNYTITIPAEALGPYHAELLQPIHIKVDKVADFRSGNDLRLKATGPLPSKLVKSEK